jgi:hypothetical protein
MKKLFLMAALLIGLAISSQAQVDGKAIGLRLGYNAELSYQHPLSDANRVELDLGLASWAGGISLNGAYHWVKDLSSVGDGFNWFYGGGLGTAIWKNYFGLGVIGQIGAEYHFELGSLPLVASLDWRPSINIIGGFGFGYASFGAGIRYKF